MEVALKQLGDHHYISTATGSLKSLKNYPSREKLDLQPAQMWEIKKYNGTIYETE